jgi:hypothetical protein
LPTVATRHALLSETPLNCESEFNFVGILFFIYK